MSERAKNLTIGGAIIVLAVLVTTLVATGRTDADRVEQIGSIIRCPVCSGESIADSPSSMAVDMMSLVAERVEAGASDDEIVDELLGSFSGAVLLDPPTSGPTLFIWIAPAVALLTGLVVIAWWRSHPSGVSKDTLEQPVVGRRLIGGAVLIGGLAVIVGVAAVLLQDGSGSASGAADLGSEKLDDVSNETMEAVIAANLDDPEIDGMRLALGERYFEDGDYRSAFSHFLAVASSPTATNDQATLALVRLGWMAYEGNGEVATATDLLDQALAITPGSPLAMYLKGQVLWCGAADPGTAAELYQEMLQQPDLPEATRERVEADLASMSEGASCP